MYDWCSTRLPDFLYDSFQVMDLVEASKSVSVLPVMIDNDVRSDCVRTVRSNTRNLLRLKRVLEMMKEDIV